MWVWESNSGYMASTLPDTEPFHWLLLEVTVFFFFLGVRKELNLCLFLSLSFSLCVLCACVWDPVNFCWYVWRPEIISGSLSQSSLPFIHCIFWRQCLPLNLELTIWCSACVMGIRTWILTLAKQGHYPKEPSLHPSQFLF